MVVDVDDTLSMLCHAADLLRWTCRDAFLRMGADVDLESWTSAIGIEVWHQSWKATDDSGAHVDVSIVCDWLPSTRKFVLDPDVPPEVWASPTLVAGRRFAYLELRSITSDGSRLFEGDLEVHRRWRSIAQECGARLAYVDVEDEHCQVLYPEGAVAHLPRRCWDEFGLADIMEPTPADLQCAYWLNELRLRSQEIS